MTIPNATHLRNAMLLDLPLILLTAAAGAEVTAEEAARLGNVLTPFGAERAGSADGRIPEWTGGITQAPAGYDPGDRHPDPFADDEVLFEITASNAEEHAVHLSAGQRALLAANPDTWKLRIYPTRRSASYPAWVYEAVMNNATTARVVLEGKGGVTGSRVGPPFPIPQSGIEAIWNHNLRWYGVRFTQTEGEAAVTMGGDYTLVQSLQEFGVPYASRSETAFTRNYPNVLLALKEKVFAPALLSGDGALIIETIDQTNDPRKVWTYSRGLRRVLRNPHIAYDFPAMQSDGLRTVDDSFLFVGPPDRFDWKLLGKREIYIPYNAYALHQGNVKPHDILRKRHINPELARYELHRVWMLEAVRKKDAEHIYSRRIFYLDEDSWNIVLSESYDEKGRLWRVNEAHTVNHYELPGLLSTLNAWHDLMAKRYFVGGLDNQRSPPRFRDGGHPREFNPNALQYYVR